MTSPTLTPKETQMTEDTYLAHQRFEHWCNKQPQRTVSLYEALEVFKDDVYSIAIQNNDTDLLWKLKNYRKGDLDIPRARQFPIEQLCNQFGLQIRMNKVKCFAHDDPNASMHIYIKTNSFYCFGCLCGGSTIDFMMMKTGCDFKTAVKHLT